MNRIEPSFKDQLQNFGIKGWTECYHCGNCTAICPHTEDGLLFPRKTIQQMQIGLSERLKSSVDPWLCYYCGDCSEKCPRDANPGELMMILRRYLTTIYDWTGLSRIFYTRIFGLIIALLLVAGSILGVAYAFNFDIHAFMEFGHRFEKLAILGVAGFILLPNILRMLWFTVFREKIKVPLSAFITGIGDLIVGMFTQKDTLKCTEHTLRWIEHFILVIGYLLLLAITVLLNWFTTQNVYLIYAGYAVGAIIFIVTFHFIVQRIGKHREVSKFSHPSDWLFVIWLFLIGLTAFMVRLFVDLGILENHFWLYLVHLIILAQWAVLIVPFGKWVHFLYRSFAIYIARLKKEAMSYQQVKNVVSNTI